ncbi:hypothetical protein HPB50_013018 [Hyalomma asiaticum]|uniref:Uncharacterized protein n=1 Tax=Hyalomma asiaticum TaxID=266040 RepID=A0ACB7T9N6_HYAAI|nr:hypothetical protein HPB50_013018 [Hyalomma asiaticum]
MDLLPCAALLSDTSQPTTCRNSRGPGPVSTHVHSTGRPRSRTCLGKLRPGRSRFEGLVLGPGTGCRSRNSQARPGTTPASGTTTGALLLERNTAWAVCWLPCASSLHAP